MENITQCSAATCIQLLYFDNGKRKYDKEGRAEITVEMKSSQTYWCKNIRGRDYIAKIRRT